MKTEKEQRQDEVAEAELIGLEFVHFKGGHYRLKAFATDTETRERVVVYEALYGDGGLWVRPVKMFFESVTREGKTMPRFQALRGGVTPAPPLESGG